MSFFERAKAAASDLAAKADVEMKKAGISTPGTPGAPGTAGGPGADRALRDFGVLAYLEATGRPASAEDKARVLATLRELESSGRLGQLTVTPAYGTPGGPPPPPGAARAASTGAADTTQPPSPPPPPAAPDTTTRGSTPPPPPPSWA